MSETRYQYCPIEADEMAEILYDMATDMDFADYDGEREQTIKDLAEVLYKVKDFGYSNEDFELLYNALSSALYLERNLRSDWRRLADLLDKVNAKSLEMMKEVEKDAV